MAPGLEYPLMAEAALNLAFIYFSLEQAAQ
jgi:hypothetical protein